METILSVFKEDWQLYTIIAIAAMFFFLSLTKEK